MKLILSCLLTLLFILLSACTPSNTLAPTPLKSGREEIKLPKKTLYAVSNQESMLSIIDASSWQVVHSVKLPQSKVAELGRDPLGRLWIGYVGGAGWADVRVQIYSPDGVLLHTLEPCDTPGGGFHFTEEKAIVVCDENGFIGKAVTLNLDSFGS